MKGQKKQYRRKSIYKSDRDRRLQQKYGRSEEEVDSILAAQQGVCAICGCPPKTRSLHLDHDHKIAKLKISSKKTGEGWMAWPTDPPYERLMFVEIAPTKGEARDKVRKKLLRLSSRGMCCYLCNRGLRMYKDSPEILRSASDYLYTYEGFLDGLAEKGNGFGV